MAPRPRTPPPSSTPPAPTATSAASPPTLFLPQSLSEGTAEAMLDHMEGEDAEEKDWAQMRNLIRIAIHNISYIRGLFPEEYFQDISVPGSGMMIKKLMPMDVESRRLIDWIEEGVYDALQKKYLETALFCICEKEEGATIDEYSFTFRYPTASCDEAVMQFCLAGSKGNGAIFKSNAAESTADQIRSLIRVCASLVSNLDQIPEERTVLMKLMYYDDVTPEDYEPPLFQSCPDAEHVKDLTQSFGRLCCISQRVPILLLDSGASHHICSDKSHMTEMRSISKDKQIKLTTSDGAKHKAKKIGLFEFEKIHLNQVHYIPNMKFNVVSIGYLDKQGLLITIVNSQISIIDVKNSVHVGEGYRDRRNNDYILKAMKWVTPDEVELQKEEFVDEDSERWVIDSCCASHMAGSLEMLTDPKPCPKEFQTPSAVLRASHKGSVSNGNVKLSDVLYCPANSDNLISVGVLDSQGYRFTFYNGKCTIVCKDTLEEVGSGTLDNKNLLYYLEKLQTRNVNHVISQKKRKK